MLEILNAIGNWFVTIAVEMTKGNFSFLILVVGIVQIIVMIRRKNG